MRYRAMMAESFLVFEVRAGRITVGPDPEIYPDADAGTGTQVVRYSAPGTPARRVGNRCRFKQVMADHRRMHAVTESFTDAIWWTPLDHPPMHPIYNLAAAVELGNNPVDGPLLPVDDSMFKDMVVAVVVGMFQDHTHRRFWRRMLPVPIQCGIRMVLREINATCGRNGLEMLPPPRRPGHSSQVHRLFLH